MRDNKEDENVKRLLIFLLNKGAHVKPLKISTKELGEILLMSQQNISVLLRKIDELELVKRTNKGIWITDKGYEELKEEYLVLKGIFEDEDKRIKGMVMSGLGEGRYYINKENYKKSVKKHTGFEPYPGTLNIKIPDNKVNTVKMLKKSGIKIKGFESEGRKFGDVVIYPCVIKGKKCAMIFPERAHHGENIIEIIASEYLRKKWKLDDGDMIKIVLE